METKTAEDIYLDLLRIDSHAKNIKNIAGDDYSADITLGYRVSMGAVELLNERFTEWVFDFDVMKIYMDHCTITLYIND